MILEVTAAATSDKAGRKGKQSQEVVCNPSIFGDTNDLVTNLTTNSTFEDTKKAIILGLGLRGKEPRSDTISLFIRNQPHSFDKQELIEFSQDDSAEYFLQKSRSCKNLKCVERQSEFVDAVNDYALCFYQGKSSEPYRRDILSVTLDVALRVKSMKKKSSNKLSIEDISNSIVELTIEVGKIVNTNDTGGYEVSDTSIYCTLPECVTVNFSNKSPLDFVVASTLSALCDKNRIRFAGGDGGARGSLSIGNKPKVYALKSRSRKCAVLCNSNDLREHVLSSIPKDKNKSTWNKQATIKLAFGAKNDSENAMTKEEILTRSGKFTNEPYTPSLSENEDDDDERGDQSNTFKFSQNEQLNSPARVKSVKQAGEETRQYGSKFLTLVSKLYHDKDSKLYHGCTMMHAILAQRVASSLGVTIEDLEEHDWTDSLHPGRHLRSNLRDFGPSRLQN